MRLGLASAFEEQRSEDSPALDPRPEFYHELALEDSAAPVPAGFHPRVIGHVEAQIVLSQRPRTRPELADCALYGGGVIVVV